MKLLIKTTLNIALDNTANAPRLTSPKRINTNASQRGFTLIELIIVIVILGILAVTAAPKFIDIGSEARIAKVDTMAAALKTAANTGFAKCQVNPACNTSLTSQAVTMDGFEYHHNFGYPDAGNSVNNHQIDTLVVHEGFTVTFDGHSNSYFSLDSAPDPATCRVTYRDSYDFQSNPNVAITTTTSGC